MKEIQLQRDYLNKYNKPFIIAGPCSAETEEQLLETSMELADTGKVDMIRAGIWKPRTRPGTFEGIGEKGLEWLITVKKETGLLIATEVANTTHVEKALEANIDVLWIGAKTTVNPFSMQELANALKGTGAKLMIKNPINPSISLWLGAIERIENAGVEIIGVIHRGFTEFGDKLYRNNPVWQIPIELMLKRPDLAFINDPSHICGNRTMIEDIAQKAMDLNFDGLMIEVHRDPENAWSDAMQQITPSRFDEIISGLKIRKTKGENVQTRNELLNYRRMIDDLDKELLSVLSKRMEVVKKIGNYKKEYNTSILQKSRWSEIIDKTLKLGKKLNLNPEFAKIIFKAIHDESINIQEKILNQD